MVLRLQDGKETGLQQCQVLNGLGSGEVTQDTIVSKLDKLGCQIGVLLHQRGSWIVIEVEGCKVLARLLNFLDQML